MAAAWDSVIINAGALTFMQGYPFTRAQERLLQAVGRVRAAKIAWGSDYPRPSLHAENS